MALAAAALSLAFATAATAENNIAWAKISPGYQPAAETDEGGLWMIGNRAEAEFRTSPLLIKDAALNSYARNIVCKLSGPYCSSIRIYILDVPFMNAAMAPNGALEIWSGLLLRAQNEAQISFVLGHEISHYLLQHTVSRYRRIRDRSGALAVFQVVTAGAGVGLVGSLAGLAVAGSVASYSRDEEREADLHGFELATAAGYDPSQAIALWREEFAEERARPEKDKSTGIFLASHPPTEERLTSITSMTAAAQGRKSDWIVGAETYRSAIQAYRARWLDANLSLAKFNQSLVVVQSLISAEPQSGELQYFLGEVYRRRNDDGDAAKALAAYSAAIAAGGAPKAVYRGLGLTSMKAGDKAAAKDAFQKYLAAEPNADDQAMIQYYISEL
jgi:predicted Zn-dependent protease